MRDPAPYHTIASIRFDDDGAVRAVTVHPARRPGPVRRAINRINLWTGRTCNRPDCPEARCARPTR